MVHLLCLLYWLKLEMRLGAGKALVVLHEAAVTTFGESYHFPNQQYLLDIFANLATDSLKFRAKEDRKIQKFMFRQMYASMKVALFDLTVLKNCGLMTVVECCMTNLEHSLFCEYCASYLIFFTGSDCEI